MYWNIELLGNKHICVAIEKAIPYKSLPTCRWSCSRAGTADRARRKLRRTQRGALWTHLRGCASSGHLRPRTPSRNTREPVNTQRYMWVHYLLFRLMCCKTVWIHVSCSLSNFLYYNQFPVLEISFSSYYYRNKLNHQSPIYLKS